MRIGPLLELTAALLGPVELVDTLTFSREATVARLRRLPGGETVVAKQPVEAELYARELEALRVLPDSVRPALVAAGDGLLVMEDLGSGPSLADVLLGADPARAEVALLAWAGTLGRALHPTLRHGVAEDPGSPYEGVEEIGRLASELGVAVPAGLDDDAATIASVLIRPGPWLAFCTNDTCPDNNRLFDDGSVRLFDFEGAGWRHAALEAAYCRAPFCTCWCVARLPDGMTGRMEAAFLDALAPAGRAAFVDVVALAAVHYTLVSFAFGWFRRFVLEDLPPGPRDRSPSTGRQYVHQRLRTVAGEGERLPALAGLAAGLAAVIARRWPEATAMPLYPAFR